MLIGEKSIVFEVCVGAQVVAAAMRSQLWCCVMRGWTLWRVREGQSTDTPADGGAGNVHEDISQIF